MSRPYSGIDWPFIAHNGRLRANHQEVDTDDQHQVSNTRAIHKLVPGPNTCRVASPYVNPARRRRLAGELVAGAIS
jgi:hypothetical protein